MSQYDEVFADLIPAKPQPATGQDYDALFADLVPARAADVPRTWGEVAHDAALTLARGTRAAVSGLAAAPVNMANALIRVSNVMHTPHPGPFYSGPVAEATSQAGMFEQPQAVQDFVRFNRMEDAREQPFLSTKAQRQQQEFAGTDGFLDATGYLATNPSFTGLSAVEQVPQLAIAAAPGGVLARAGALSGRAALGTTIGLQSAMAGGMNANDVSAELAERVAAGEMAQAEADRRVADVFAGTAVLNVGTSLIPGARSVERALTGQLAKIPAGRAIGHAATSFAGEAAQEMLAECGEQILQNLATDAPWNQGVGQAAALGGVLGGMFGGTSGSVEALAQRGQAPSMTPKPQAEDFLHAALKAMQDAQKAQPQAEPTPAPDHIVDASKKVAPESESDIDALLLRNLVTDETAPAPEPHVNKTADFDARPEGHVQKTPESTHEDVPTAPAETSTSIIDRAKATIRRALAIAKGDKQHNDRYELLPVADSQVTQAAEHGLEIAGYRHIIDGSAIRHTFKHHGNPKTEQSRGQVAVTDADLESIPDILAAPDEVLYGLKNKIGRDVIGYLKKMPDGSTVYLEEVRTGQGVLATQSMWRYPPTVHASSIKKTLRHTSETLQGHTATGPAVPQTNSTTAPPVNQTPDEQRSAGKTQALSESPHEDDADVRFSRQQLVDKETKDTWEHAQQNGKTKLDYRQWTQVRTPAFKRWFGDWESGQLTERALDNETGEPAVYIHSGGSEFSQLRDKGRFGQMLFLLEGESAAYGDKDFPLFVSGKILERETLADALRSEQGKALLEKHLSGRNVTSEGVEDIIDAIEEAMYYPETEAALDALGAVDQADAQFEYQTLLGKLANGLGYAAIRIEDEFDGKTIAVVRPSAIKSASENSGSFDANHPDIFFSRSRAQIQAVIDAARQPGHAPQKAVLGKVSDWLVQEAKQHGLNLDGFTHTLDGSAVRHMFNRHGNEATEKAAGQIAVTEADIQNIPQVIEAPDQVILGTQTRGHKDAIVSIKRMDDGTVLYIEEVRTGRSELAATSIRKYPATRDLSSVAATVPSYARSDSGDGAIVLSPENKTQTQAIQRVEAVVDTVRKGWTAAPDVVVASDMADVRLPKDIREADAKARSQGASGDVDGVYWRGKVYLIASNLKSDADIARVMFHEILGHHGLRGAFGEALNPLLDQLAQVRIKDIAKKREEYGLPDTQEGRRLAAEEVLASMAETAPHLGWIKRAIAAIRAWLRKAGLNLTLTDNDLIAQFILPAQHFVLRGEQAQSRFAEPVFSRGQPDKDWVEWSMQQVSSAPMRKATTFQQAREAAKDFQGNRWTRCSAARRSVSRKVPPSTQPLSPMRMRCLRALCMDGRSRIETMIPTSPPFTVCSRQWKLMGA